MFVKIRFCLYFFRKLVEVAWLLMGLPTLTEAYSYPYYYCAKPSNLETYDCSSLCAASANPLALAPEATWQLLQLSRSVEIDGYSCNVIKSLLQGYCGVWGS